MFVLRFLSVGALALLGAHGAHLPSYIKACRKDNPEELNKCAKERAASVIPYIIKGDKQFHTPVLSPLKIPEINIHAGDMFHLKLSDSTLKGLENMVVKDIALDLKKRHISVTVTSNYLNLESHYVIHGRILVLPIEGQGPSNITMNDGEFTFLFDYKVVKKNGKDYIEMEKPDVKYKFGKTSYHFDDLFNGDRKLGDEMNKFLNENSETVGKDIGPSVSETINAIVSSILKAYFDRIPYDEIFV